MPTPPARISSALLCGVLLASGCNSTSESKDSPTPGRPNAQLTPSESGTAGALIAIDSDNVAQAGYDADTQVMTVMFDQGRLYEYYEVPPELWDAFIAAQPDPWSLVGYPQLVQGGYAYREITQ